eukprot:CAMPEP_0197661078 /NCGR_PEP_ID=MMETSP1338-20131121/51239_1 /TAXON_ID=43686 ORGANISM="Pelagodinium beii, Strain RCC1491" /NCGR_SAMPLE_ID=MMETSP1338 /ASSEMBLY_ACC=CAM_ASM_000754 /LENGTH=44 /DNA_ID= /DNA_START= /DNA_END= /DNA_ORIENTATION=
MTLSLNAEGPLECDIVVTLNMHDISSALVFFSGLNDHGHVKSRW